MRWSALGLAVAATALAGCNDSQSILAARGMEAGRTAILSWVLFGGGTLILVLIIVIAAAALYGPDRWRERLSREAVVIGGGIVFPAVTLTVLLAYGLVATRAGGFAAGDGKEPLRMTVVGEQWWWRVIYEGDDGSQFESANEVRIPVGRRVEVALTTADVIHSFWVPNLAGKVDMIPGRTNTITLQAEQPGISRGQCAEYCGGAHALMAFNVLAMEPDTFETWFVQEAGPTEPPESGSAEARGELLFLSSGCGGCHTVRGTDAKGTIGPDLTHVGGRTTLAAGILPNTEDAIALWITENQHIKPENLMPPFDIYSERELADLSSYLAGRK